MIKSTFIKTVSGKLKNGSLKISLSFACEDQEELKRFERFQEMGTLVSIDIKEVPV